MVDITLLYLLKSFYAISFPAEITATINSVDGNTVTLSTTTGTTDDWLGGVLQVNDATSDFNRLFGIVIGNEGNVVTLKEPIISRKSPTELVGKTVVLSGGPLSKSRIYITDPDNVEKAFSGNKEYLVVVNLSGGGLKQRTVGAALGKGVHSTSTESDIEIACETKDITTNSTATDVFKAAFGIHILRHQIMFLTHMYVASVIRPTIAPEYNYQQISYTRPGSDIKLRACVIEFQLNIV
jgi:hypothetical protein